MNPPVFLPEKLQKKYKEISEQFNKISEDWKKYEDEIIPQNPEFAKKIISFLIEVIEYIEKNYAQLDLLKCKEFLRYYYYEFYYGPNGDDRSYLDFDEISISELLMELREDEPISKKELENLKKELAKAQKQF